MVQTARCFLFGLLTAGARADYAANESASIASDPDAGEWLSTREDASDVSELNSMLQHLLPSINSKVKSKIPDSVGACNMNGDRRRRRRRTESAPTPCDGGDCTWLYYTKKSWEYEVIARWLGGLKSIELTDAVVSKPTSKELTLSVKGFFGNLPLSLYIGECFTFNICSKLWDNTYACCGSNKHFDISVSAICSSDPSKGPIERLEVSGIDVDKIEIREKIAGISFNTKDLTGTVEAEVKKKLGALLTDEIIPLNGHTVTLMEFLNTPGTIQNHIATGVCTSSSASATTSSLSMSQVV